jgi:hypothetical protein
MSGKEFGEKSLVKIGNSKWPPGGCLSMKTMHICICSRLKNMDRFFRNLVCRLV